MKPTQWKEGDDPFEAIFKSGHTVVMIAAEDRVELSCKGTDGKVYGADVNLLKLDDASCTDWIASAVKAITRLLSQKKV